MKKSILLTFMILAACLAGATAGAITRDEVVLRAQGYAYHPWTCGYANLTASCSAGYHSVYTPGDYFGLPYDWGGYLTLFQFDKGILDGKGAGSYSSDGVLSCTVGLDCSGFVSKVWDVGHFGTATIHNTSHEIPLSGIKKADAFNIPGYHVVLFGGTVQNNWPVFYEAINYNTQINMYGGWAYVSGFTPIRLDSISDTPGSDLGTQTNPIKVNQFPFVHSGNTASSLSDMFDACGANDAKTETGPEVIYELNITKPGTLTVHVQDDAGVDIDVHVYSEFNTYDCIARHDTDIELPGMACGTWYVVADTWANSGGTEFPGPYTITIDFQPTGSSCSQWVEQYSYSGLPGQPCSYEGNPNLPFCNPNLGAQICLYSDQPGSQFSFCSFLCQSDQDCQTDFPDGCCADITGSGDPQDFFCVEKSFCGPVTPPPVDEGPDPIEEIKPQDQDIIFLPYIFGSNYNSKARACFIGMDSRHKRAHMVRAVFEGVVFCHMVHIEKLLQNRKATRAIRLAGGAAKSRVWAQMFSDVCGLPVEIIDTDELGTLGCAMAAAVAAGDYPSLDAAAESMVKIKDRLHPNLERQGIYREKLVRYKRVSESLDGTW